MRTLLATDLASAEPHDGPWRRSRIGCHSPRNGEWVTSAGYAFAERTTTPKPDALHVLILAPEQAGSPPGEDREGLLPLGGTRPRRRLTLAIPRGELVVEVGRGRARVGIEASQWTACASPILLAISVCWRFEEIEEFLDELSAWTRSQLQATGGHSTGGRGREFDRRCRALHALIVDLPSFEGSLDDPSGYFASRDEARLYWRLARRLQLVAWRTRLDERIEILEGAVGHIVEERRHRQQLRWEIVLESLILLVILGDIVLHLTLALLE